MVPKLPDYEERTAALAKQCEENERKTLAEVSSVLLAALKASAEELVNLTASSDESIRLQAVKHHLKLAGLEIEKSEVNNKGTMSLTISSEQAKKVINAANDADKSGNL